MKLWLFLLLVVVFISRFAVCNIAITTKSVPNGTTKTDYSAVINATGGCTPYKWTMVSGALPTGITAKVSSTKTSLDLAGTPTKAGTYSFTEKVTGCGGQSAEASYKVVIQATANHVADLSWKASRSSDVVGYNVYRGPNGTTWTKINVSLVASTLYSDATVADGTTYYYATTAVDVNGHESSKTTAVKAVIP
jgi:putative Ig domain-containing protein